MKDSVKVVFSKFGVILLLIFAEFNLRWHIPYVQSGQIWSKLGNIIENADKTSLAGPRKDHGIWQRRDKTLVSRRATETPCYLAACCKTWFSESRVCETVFRKSLRSQYIVWRLAFSNAWAYQASQSYCVANKNRRKNTFQSRLRDSVVFPWCYEIAGSCRDAVRYHGLFRDQCHAFLVARAWPCYARNLKKFSYQKR